MPAALSTDMVSISNEDLIEKAVSVINSKNINDHIIGNVGAALVSIEGNLYFGVCIDTSSSMGFCAEASAVAAMVTAGELKIKKIVAVWKKGNDVYILPLCGRCREFIAFLDKENINTDVIIEKEKVVKLSELLPHYREYNKLT